MIARFILPESSIPLVDQRQNHSFDPTTLRKAAARSGGQGRPLGWRECASSLTAARTAAPCRSAWTMLSLVVAVAIVACVEVREASCETLSESSSSSTVGDGFIAEASERFAIPAAWIHAIICVEGGGDARLPSRKGAIGLMRIMPETWTELRFRYALGADPSEPRDNILAGAAHLREMYDRYGSKGFLPAYILGPTRYDDHLKTGAPLPAETQAYVAVLAPLIEPGLKDVVRSTARGNVISWRKAPLFIGQPKHGSNDNPSASRVRTERSSPYQSGADQPAFAPHSTGLFVSRGMEARSQ